MQFGFVKKFVEQEEKATDMAPHIQKQHINVKKNIEIRKISIKRERRNNCTTLIKTIKNIKFQEIKSINY